MKEICTDIISISLCCTTEVSSKYFLAFLKNFVLIENRAILISATLLDKLASIG